MTDDTIYSYSRLDTYEQCPFKFYLKYILNKSISFDNIALTIGTLIHETEEKIAKQIINGETIDYIALKNNIIAKLYYCQQRFNSTFYTQDKAGKTYTDKIYNYLKSGIYNLENFMLKNKELQIVAIEKYFNISCCNKQIQGYIDRAFYNKVTDRYIIQDIKTYAVPVDAQKLTTPMQFVIYALAIKELFNCDLDQISCQYYLPFCNITQAAGTANYVERGIKHIDKLFNNIEAENFVPKPCPLCNYCEFSATNPDSATQTKYLCPYFSLWNRETRNKADIKKVNCKWGGLNEYPALVEAYKKEITKEVN